MTKDQKRRQYCGGCHDNFYNGNNPMGVKECWALKNAKVVWKKFVHIDQRPPWTQKAVRTLNCCNRERYITVGPKVTS